MCDIVNDFEEIKQQIAVEKYNYISFDIFDTILTRPFWEPSDLFYLLDVEFEKYVQSEISFYKIRLDGEVGARSESKEKYPAYQDITIDEIYLYIERIYGISNEICQHMKKYEMELELRFLTKRESGKELYDFALACGKKIIFITDMYLGEEFIRTALEKNGYIIFEKLFVSSKERLLKKSGDLYTFVLENVGILGTEILHIGDNLKSDIEMAKKNGINSCYVPRTIEQFKKRCGIEESDFKIKMPLLGCSTVIDYRQVESSIGFRCMLAIIANKYFDNAFRPFLTQSDFNNDPYFMGYYAVGMHLVGLNRWIEEKVINKNYRYIWFASRDGWLIMHAYNILREMHKDLPEAKYIYLSRESTLPAQIMNKLDFYDLPIEFWKYSPETLLNLLNFCCIDTEEKEIVSILEKRNIAYTKKFRNVVEYHKFISIFLEKFYSNKKHLQEKEIIYKYFTKVSEKDLIFDMGYSGRIYCALSNLLAKRLNVLFIYGDAVKCYSMCRKGRFDMQTFYDYTPSMPGMLREFFLSSKQPSCIGYKLNNRQESIPVFSEEESHEKDYICEMIHKGALEFVAEFYNYFGSYMNYIFFKATEVALPFEGMLGNISETDRMVFEKLYSEDKIYGRNLKMNIAKFWKNKMDEKIGEFFIKDIVGKDIK